MHNKCEYIKFKNFEIKIKLSLMIHADFETSLVPEENGKQNLLLTNIKNMLLLVMVIN